MTKNKKLLSILLSLCILLSCLTPFVLAESDVFADLKQVLGKDNVNIEGNTVNLQNHIMLNSNLDIPSGTVFNGNGYIITFNADVHIKTIGDVVLKNLFINNHSIDWSHTYSVFISGEGADVTFNNVKINTDSTKYGITVCEAHGATLKFIDTTVCAHVPFAPFNDCSIDLNENSKLWVFNHNTLANYNNVGAILINEGYNVNVNVTGLGEIYAESDNTTPLNINGVGNQSTVTIAPTINIADQTTQNDLENLSICTVDGYVKKADGTRVYKRYLLDLFALANDGETIVVSDDLKTLPDAYKTTEFSTDKNITIDLNGTSVGAIKATGNNTVTVLNTDSKKVAFGSAKELGNVIVGEGAYLENVFGRIPADSDLGYNANTGFIYPPVIAQLLTDGKIKVPAASPETFEQSYAYINWYLSQFWGDGYEIYSTGCENGDYTKTNIGLHSAETYELINSYYDVEVEFVNADPMFKQMVEDYSSRVEAEQTFEVLDLEVINYWVSGYANESQMSPAQNLANYSGELKEFLNNSNISISFETGTGMGWGDMFETAALGDGVFIYNGIAYSAFGPFGALAKHVIYVDDSVKPTKEALMSAAQKRIDDYIGITDKVTITYGGLFADVAQDCEYVNDWQDFDASAVEHYFVVNINGRSQNIFIVPNSSKMVKPTYKTADMVTAVEISSNASEIPLDTKVDAKQLYAGETFNKIIEVLGVGQNETYDLKLYSNTLGDYVSKLENGYFTVKVPLKPELLNKDLVAYFVDNNNKVTQYSVTVKDGIAEFVTDHFSIYTIAEKTPDEPIPEITIVDTAKIFNDVKADGWYKQYIDYAYSHKLLIGVNDKEFGIDQTLTRGMFITVLARIHGIDTTYNANKDAKQVFTDVKAGMFYSKAVEWAKQNNIVAGYLDATFRPNDGVSREELCKMLVNYANFAKITLKSNAKTIEFIDADKISTWAKDAVTACQKAGIVIGYKSGSQYSFRPADFADRAEGAKMLACFYSDYIK